MSARHDLPGLRLDTRSGMRWPESRGLFRRQSPVRLRWVGFAVLFAAAGFALAWLIK